MIPASSTSLKSIAGPRSASFRDAVAALSAGQLPPDWKWVRSSPNSVVAQRIPPHAVFYKEFLPRSPWEGLKTLFRGSRCKRAREQVELLIANGFFTPAIVCWGRLSAGREFMISEAVDGVGFADYLASFLSRQDDAERLRWKRGLLATLGEQVGRMHRSGICHGDLRPNNLLLELGSNPPRFHLIDNERNSRYRRVPEKLVKKNLVQIGMFFPEDVTLTDRMRFFRAYCRAYGRYDLRQQRVLAAEVHKRTVERLSVKKRENQYCDCLPPECFWAGPIPPGADADG